MDRCTLYTILFTVLIPCQGKEFTETLTPPLSMYRSLTFMFHNSRDSLDPFFFEISLCLLWIQTDLFDPLMIHLLSSRLGILFLVFKPYILYVVSFLDHRLSLPCRVYRRLCVHLVVHSLVLPHPLYSQKAFLGDII